MSQRKLTLEQDVDVVRRWQAGATQVELALAFNVSTTVISGAIRRAKGLPRSSPSEAGGKFPLIRAKDLLPKPTPKPVEYPENPPKLPVPCEVSLGESECFWSHVDLPNGNGCRLWHAYVHKSGYGHFRVGAIIEYAHRVSWRLTYGPIPEGMSVLHKCDVRRCVEPTHFWLGTKNENMKDMVAKGRARGHSGEAHYRTGLTWEKVREIRRLRCEKGLTQQALADMFGASRRQIGFIVTGKTWKECDPSSAANTSVDWRTLTA